MMGNSLFKNFTVLDSFTGGFASHKTNYTKEDVILDDWILVGRS